MLLLAAVLTVCIGLSHSILGERYLLMRLFKRDNLPQLNGSVAFTKATLRFAWHITSVAWFGFAALLAGIHFDAGLETRTVLYVTAAVFGASMLLSLIPSRGKHYSWVVFLAIAVLALASAYSY